MKKLIVFIIAIVAVCYTPSYATNFSASEAPACVTVGNVSANVVVESSRTYVSFYNSNLYRVSVVYTVTALNASGQRVEVGGGTVSLDSKGETGASRSVTISSGYTGYSVRITVSKCS